MADENTSKGKHLEKKKNIENKINPKTKKEKYKRQEINLKMKIEVEKLTEIIDTVAKQMRENKTIPKVELDKIHYKVFQNVCLAIITMLYLDFIGLGFINIKNDVFITDLKVFSIVLLIVSIGIFEYAYKRDSGKYAIHGIEVLLLSFITMVLMYMNLIWTSKFTYIVSLFAYIYAIYYVAKAIIMYYKMRKKYFVNEMKEIIKK